VPLVSLTLTPVEQTLVLLISAVAALTFTLTLTLTPVEQNFSSAHHRSGVLFD
jgi:hypothetical protein